MTGFAIPAHMVVSSHHRLDHPSVAQTAIAVHTLSGATHPAKVALVISRDPAKMAAHLTMSPDEATELVSLLLNGIEDARRIDQGKPPIHTISAPIVGWTPPKGSKP